MIDLAKKGQEEEIYSWLTVSTAVLHLSPLCRITVAATLCFQVECFGWVHLPLGNEGGGMGRRVGSLLVACCMHVKLSVCLGG